MNEPTIEKLDKLSQLARKTHLMQEEHSKNFHRARAPSIVEETEVKKLVTKYPPVSESSESESSELETELNNLLQKSHGKAWEKKFNDSLHQQTEKIRDSSIGRSSRARSRSWLEVKEKFIKELDTASSSSSKDFSQGQNQKYVAPATNPIPKKTEMPDLPKRNRSQTLPVEPGEPAVQEDKGGALSWWEQMKSDLISEEVQDPNPLAESQMTVQQTESASSVSGSWWDNLKADLETDNPRSEKEKQVPSAPSSLSAATGQAYAPLDVKHLAPVGHSVSESGANPVAKRGVLKFDNGLYRGDTLVVKNKKDLTSVAHGFGSFHNSQGEFFLGQWHMGKRHGKGIKKWDDGREYCGDWEFNRRSGHGMITWTNGDTYIGEISCGFQQGHGILKCNNGERYIGEWNVNERHGYGVLHFLNGDIYAGEWKHNKKDGWGVYKFSDGRCIYGEWKDNEFVLEATNSVELKKKQKKKEKIRHFSKYDFQHEDDMLPRPPTTEPKNRRPSIGSTDSSTEPNTLSDSSQSVDASSTNSSPKPPRRIQSARTSSKVPKDSGKDPKPNS